MTDEKKPMKLDSVLKKSKNSKKYQSRKWLLLVFVLVFGLTSVSFTHLGLAQEGISGENASSTPETLLPEMPPQTNPPENASSTPTLPELPIAQDTASSTPETFNASSTEPTSDSLNQNASSTPILNCGNSLIEESEQCDDGNLIDGDGCNSTCKKEVIVPNDVATGMNLNFSDNERPVIQAVWQMNQATSTDSQGMDDSLADGAQFMPSGQYQVDKPIQVCAVVSDPDGLADISSVSAQIYYPKDIYLGANRASAQPGCGQPKEEWFLMRELESSQGLNLFCEQLRNKNANLASFKTGNDFESLCGIAGDLTKETSRVFCGQNNLAYQDPAGEYRVKVVGLDQKKSVGVLENSFKYLELVAFDIDFNNIDYGSMRLNSPKVLSGNDAFLANDGRPTLRNIGNTRLNIEIKQNDMDLGQSEKGWNLTYQARVGQDASFTSYWPEAWANLASSMNLGQSSALDLAVEVLKFPEITAGEHYAGKLSLNATAAAQLMCAE